MVNQIKIRVSFLSLLILAIAIISACAMGVYNFRRSFMVSDTFEKFSLLKDYDYYYNGLPYSPDAVVAIRKGYTLTSPYWHRAEISEQKLRKWMGAMLNVPGAEYNTAPNGAYICNDDGERIGIWYSVWDFPLLKFISAKELYISDTMPNFPPGHHDPEEGVFSPFF